MAATRLHGIASKGIKGALGISALVTTVFFSDLFTIPLVVVLHYDNDSHRLSKVAALDLVFNSPVYFFVHKDFKISSLVVKSLTCFHKIMLTL